MKRRSLFQAIAALPLAPLVPTPSGASAEPVGIAAGKGVSIEIVVTSNQDPSRIARLVREQMDALGRFV